MGLRFEWDVEKATDNYSKHGVMFDEAASVFLDPLTALFDDDDHSIAERRGIMNEAKTPEAGKTSDELLAEYRFDYSAAKPNRFAAKASEGSVVVLLDEELARVFKTPESVRAVLRALVNTMPSTGSDDSSSSHVESSPRTSTSPT